MRTIITADGFTEEFALPVGKHLLTVGTASRVLGARVRLEFSPDSAMWFPIERVPDPRSYNFSVRIEGPVTIRADVYGEPPEPITFASYPLPGE
jgi:hypothetical protein